MVERAYGACKTRDFDVLQSNRSVVVRGDVSQMAEDRRVLKRTLDTEDDDSSSEHTTTTNDGNILPEDSNESTDSSELENEWILYQIDDIGVNAHFTLGYVPIEMANMVCEGMANSMEFDLACGYIAQCDYNETVSLGH